MRALTTVTFAYVTHEDRVLAAINAGQPEAWSCWLTRRMILSLLERAAEFVASTSTLAQRAPADFRGEFVAFERDAAMATTKGAMTKTSADVLTTSAKAAELAKQLTISNQAGKFRLELSGESGDGAAGILTRAEIQRILQMLQIQAAKAGWIAAHDKSSAAPATAGSDPKPFRN